MADAELARFIDRFTVEYVRTYAHPVERVWRAVTDPAEFSAIAAAWARDAHGYGLTPAQGVRIVRGLRRQERWNELNKVYREHIRTTLPPAD